MKRSARISSSRRHDAGGAHLDSRFARSLRLPREGAADDQGEGTRRERGQDLDRVIAGEVTPHFAEIVVTLPVEGRFHYGVPAHLLGELAIGHRVLVPFG